MVTKLHRDALMSDIAFVRALLDRVGDRDVLNAVSLSTRLENLEAELRQIEDEVVTTADVALVFDGGPVTGSHAIDADFAGRALQDYQQLITKQVAASDFGGMAERGPIQQGAHNAARMNVTALVHGSFGFVLQEDHADEPQLFDSVTRKAVQEVSDLLTDVAAATGDAFESRLHNVDARIFQTLRRFVSHLYKANSTLRIAEQEREVRLDRVGLSRAYERLRNSEITEKEEAVLGELLGLVPIQRRFEFRREDTNEVIQGRVAPNLSADYLERLEREEIVAGRTWRAIIRTKTVEHPDQRHVAVTHTLLDLIQD